MSYNSPDIEPNQIANNTEVIRQRPVVKGKFIFVGEKKLYIRGTTYGTFCPAIDGSEYLLEKVEQDFAKMAAVGLNAVRTYTVPPRWLLDIAARHGLYVMVGLPWEQHIAFMDDTAGVHSIMIRVREGVRSCAGHPALLCYTIGNEIPAPIVRWYGHRRIEGFLKKLYKAAKDVDPEGLVTYVNYPSTEYLDLSFIDFLCFNVYLEKEERLSAYMARLQNIAGDRPLVMAEIGLDSRRNGKDKQAEILAWQVRTVFEAGCAGAFVFAWTDEWYRGGHDIEDWDFGLVTRKREAKPALESVRNAFAEIPISLDQLCPRISVVICTYNGGWIIRDCLDGLLELDYPNYEVIVVDDGSTDNTSEIVQDYPFRLIMSENLGVSSARNTGLQAATGEIVAYTDDDARPDPHWLTYLAKTFMETNHAGVGGPNIALPGDGMIADCVANAPGGPVHVLLSDTVAEHIPGCNSAYRKACLEEIGGWDPKYRMAGDDVDVCWRLQEKGYTIGFSPAAMVWHHRRNSIKAYWKQQVGYGRAESLLEEKWPEKYNAVGHVAWSGRLYGNGLTQALISNRGRIYQGRWGSALFQSVYEPTTSPLWSLPLMPEWFLVVISLMVISVFGIFWFPLLVGSLPLLIIAVGAIILQALLSASKASFPSKPESRYKLCLSYILTTFLHILQPLARLHGRLRYGLTPWRRRGTPKGAIPLPYTEVIWTERWLAPDKYLRRIDQALKDEDAVVNYGGDFDRWDLEVRGGIMGSARLLMVTEEHGGGRQLLRFKVWPKSSLKVIFLIFLLVSLTISATADYFLEGGMSWVAALYMGVISLLLLRLMYKECAAPLAAIHEALSTLKLSIEEAFRDQITDATRTATGTPSNDSTGLRIRS